jgi:hypothetical protein
MKNVRKFVKHDIPDLAKLENTPAYKLLKHFNEGGTIKSADKELIRLVFNELWHPDTYRHGIYKLQGYIFDFSDYLKTFLVKDKYYGWQEYKSFNKSWVRENSTSPSHIIQIVELPA